MNLNLVEAPSAPEEALGDSLADEPCELLGGDLPTGLGHGYVPGLGALARRVGSGDAAILAPTPPIYPHRSGFIVAFPPG